MQAQLEEMSKQMEKEKRKQNTSQTTPSPKQPAPSPASSAPSVAAAKPKPKPAPSASLQDPSDSESDIAEGASGEEGASTLTVGARNNRLRRICERKPSNKLNVPLKIHEQWKKGGHAREELMDHLEAAGWDKDYFWVYRGYVSFFTCVMFNACSTTLLDDHPSLGPQPCSRNQY